jgi:ribosome maturation factor RimP
MAQQRGRAVDRPPRQGASRAAAVSRPHGHGADLTRLREIVARCSEESGYDLEHLSVKRMGQRHVVRIVVDGDEGVDLDRVAILSRQISKEIDAAETSGVEIIPGEYDLEVGSPGVDRPLTAPRHWRRNRGRLVTVRVGGRSVTGRVIEADDTGVLFDVDGARQRFDYAGLGSGRVQVEFSRPSDDNDGDDGAGDVADDVDDADFDDFDADVTGVTDDEIDDEREDEE